MRYQVYFYCLLCHAFIEFGTISVNVNNVHSDPTTALQEALKDYHADRKKSGKEYVSHVCWPGEKRPDNVPPMQVGVAIFAGLRRL